MRHSRISSRLLLFCLLSWLALFAVARADPAVGEALSRTAQFDIKAQSLATALIEFSQQAQVQVTAPATMLEHLATRGVHGRMPVSDALQQLLSGTHLGFHAAGVNTIGINRVPASAERASAAAADDGRATAPPVAGAPISQSDGSASPALASPPELTEVIVTASKRREREGDVAGALTVFSGASLLDQGYTSFKDYAGLTPGLQVVGPFGSGEPIIRGISAGSDTGALVGIVVDGAPIGSSSSLTSVGALDALDLDPIDFSRVEILKGPQGTLYGANTLAGLISYTLTEPDLQQGSAVVRGSRSATEDGEPSYTVRGAVSLPVLSDELGVRLSAYREVDGGFIDNSMLGIPNQDEADHWGAMASALFKPSDALRIMVTGFFQDYGAVPDKVLYDPKTHQPVDGELSYDSPVYPTSSKRTRVGLATIDYDLGFATLTSVTSYQRVETADQLNGMGGGLATVLQIAPAFGGQPFPPPGALAMGTGTDVRKFTQEARLASSGPSPLQWLVGGYYSDESDDDYEPMVGRTGTGAVLPSLDPAIYFNLPSTYREYSAFADLTYKLTQAFELTGGIRLGHIDQSYAQYFGGSDAPAYDAILTYLGAAPTPFSVPVSRSSQNITNYLATARYHITRDTMVYARFATGFRPGGPNTRINGLPPAFQPDKTQDYELGAKSAFWDGRGALDLTGYYMRWNGILLPIQANGIDGLGNGGNAESYGVEANLMLRPLERLTLNATVAESHAHIVSTDSNAAGAVGIGDPLPYDPQWSGSLAADYRVPIRGEWAGDFGATYRYDGSRHSGFESSLEIPDYVLPSYSLLDLRAGLESDRIDLTLYADNITNDRAELGATTAFGPTEITIERPRTIGAMVTVRF
jgi:outer membrane receptor protein involved in Fe transport